jgi:tRNA/tmRNA/rRNA uracil-C5-methylase (TrmA/RlmC/RlmD family)
MLFPFLILRVWILQSSSSSFDVHQVGSAADALRAGEAEGADILIVDPPRKGLEPDVLACLCDPSDPQADSVHTLVYVSCGFDALAWQLPQLVEHGGWRLDHSEGFALFPGSDHIEILCVLRRTPLAPN